jgi:hypothetical protein
MNTTLSRPFRRLKILLVIVVVLCLAGVIALRFALGYVKDEIRAALGPASEIEAINLRWDGLEIIGLRLPAKNVPGWPADNLIAAGRIVIIPSFGDLLGGKVVLRSVHVEGAYVALLRGRKGSLEMPYAPLQTKFVPADVDGMLAAGKRFFAPGRQTVWAGLGISGGTLPGADKVVFMASTVGAREITVERIEIAGGVVEFFDVFIRQPAHKIRLENVNARLEHLRFPALKGETDVHLEAEIKGPHQNGKLKLTGWADISRDESKLDLQMTGVDFSVLEAYLISAAESGGQGSLDLEIHSQVIEGRLYAPGVLSLSHLALSNPNQSFMGVPGPFVTALLRSSQGRIELQFSQEGNLRDPRFSLGESLAKTISEAFARTLMSHVGGMLQELAKDSVRREEAPPPATPSGEERVPQRGG